MRIFNKKEKVDEKCRKFVDNFLNLNYDDKKLNEEYIKLLEITTNHWKLPGPQDHTFDKSNRLLIIKLKNN